MAWHLVRFFKLSLAVVVLVFILPEVSNGTIDIEDGREMGISIISEGLRTAGIPDYRTTSNLNGYGTLVTDIRNLAVSNVRLTDSTSLALEDHNTIDIVTSDLSLNVRADWEVDLQSFFWSFDDVGTISYQLNPVSINLRYTFETRDGGLPQTFRQVSCQPTVHFSSPIITAANGDSWLYSIIMNHLEEDLKDDVRNEICKMLDPQLNSAVYRRLSSYADEFLPKCPDIPNAILIGCSMTAGDLCSVTCAEGYTMGRHLSSIRCSGNKEWNVETESLCQAITCQNSNGACNGEGEVCVNDNPTGVHCECEEDYERSDDGSRCVALPPPLEFVSRQEDLTAREEETVRMHCEVNDEEATYFWFKGDRQLLDGDIDEGVIVLSSSLVILNVRESDSDTYTCVARNSRGHEVRSSSLLTVTPHPDVVSTPVFIQRPVDTDLVLGEDFVLRCSVDDQSAVITWYKDEIRIEDGTSRNVFLTEENGLLITNAGFEHQGTYKCVATTQENVPAEAIAILAFPTEDIFATQPSDASVLVGEDHLLRCSSQNPTLTVDWQKDGSPLIDNRRIFRLRGRVLLRNVIESDTGVYSCIASDIRGNQVASISAQVTVLLHGLNGLQCGTVTSSEVRSSNDEASRRRIVGGHDAVRGSAPWMARLYVRGRGHVCGGSLIDRQWVVTSAHCFDMRDPPSKEDLSIRLGDHNDLDTEQSELLIQVEEIYEHEEFDRLTFNHDIALIKLLNPVTAYNDYIRPICLANRTKDRALMTPGALGRVNGWGRITEGGITAEYLTEVYIPLVSFNTCKRHFRRSDLTFTRNMFCAGHSRGGADACQGDSGGPYSIKDNTGQWYLTGLVSWGEGCGREGQYGSYTRYSKYHGWIQRKINMMG